MDGETMGSTASGQKHGPRRARWPILLCIGVVVSIVSGVILLKGQEASTASHESTWDVPSWIVGYVGNPTSNELILVLELCEDEPLDEWWTMPSDDDRVVVYVGLWNLFSYGCETPELRTVSFSLSKPLGDRAVYDAGGSEIPRYTGELPDK